MRVLAELGKPAIEDTRMGQTVDEQMSPSKSPRSAMGWRGEGEKGVGHLSPACVGRLGAGLDFGKESKTLFLSLLRSGRPPEPRERRGGGCERK